MVCCIQVDDQFTYDNELNVSWRSSQEKSLKNKRKKETSLYDHRDTWLLIILLCTDIWKTGIYRVNEEVAAID